MFLGLCWEYRFESAKIEGKRNQISKGGFRTKKECMEAGTKALAEAFALTWDDIDFENNIIDINKQIQMDEQIKKWTFSEPKYDSFRKIKCDSIMMSILAEEKIKQERAKEYYAEHYSQLYVNKKRQLCFEGKPINMVISRENGTYIQPRVTQHLGRIVHYKLGYKEFDFHSLRHTHATILLEAGANPKDVQDRLGHKSIEITMQIYAHVTLKMQNDTISILESIPK